MSHPFARLLGPVSLILALTGSAAAARAAGSDDDPYLWLEAIDGERALEWVERQNAETADRLTDLPLYQALYRDALAVLTSAERLPAVAVHGDWLYNLWQDADHPRGLLRRATLAEYRKASPDWQTVLDLDALSRSERVQWAFKGLTCLPPEELRCLVKLSPGGGDAVEIRELDMRTLAFVKDGFRLPVAKSDVAWIDADTLFVATDFGAGSLTESGYPRIVKRWRRGTALADAETLHQGRPASVGVTAERLRSAGAPIDLVTEQTTFWTFRYHQLLRSGLVPLELPPTAIVEDAFDGRLVIKLEEDWPRGGRTFAAGAVVIADPAALRGGEGDVEPVVEPSAGEVVSEVAVVPQGILVAMLDNVRGRVYRYEPGDHGWQRRPIAFPDNGALTLASVDHVRGDFFVRYESFLTPPTLYHVAADDPRPGPVKAQAPSFDASGFTVDQLWTESADGTRIPYFVVHPKEWEKNGRHPVWMFSYGGFRNALTPSYSGSYEALEGAYGRLWLERGGVFVLANIRGGGEFGPSWHRGALRENHVKTFEDFEAVARDLVARGITTPERIGIEGRSNGGLLVLSTMIREPALYGAVVAGVPLSDMRRYDKLLAGASWVGEYGDPDVPEDWAFLSMYSPYQNLRAGQDYPPLLIYTSTRDDRVHPGHARKTAARLQALGYSVEYYENTEGGHHGSITPKQLAHRIALTFTFLWRELGGGSRSAPPNDAGEDAG
ncbi:MAG TPA: prolyl oligopeptidase family serine peptidase [Pseudomonadales bacterium]